MPHHPMQHQFDQLHQAARSSIDVDWPERQHRLQQLAQMVRCEQEAIKTAISSDFGQRSHHETALLEIFPTLAGIDHALKHGKRWMKPRKVSTHWHFWPAKSHILVQPLGVIGIVTPWNYPLYLSAGPLLAALAAGNRAMIKTSEHAPAFAQWLAEAIPQYFAADEVAVVQGDAQVAATFCALPFDHLLFTGSTAVGRLVMQAAAANLTPVTLELGGKSPTIILEDADLDQAVARVMSGKLLNAGQTCIAPDYVLVPASLENAFAAKARTWVLDHYPDLATNPDYSHIINPQQQQRLQQYLHNAQSQGATIEPLSNAPAEHSSANTLLPPYIVRHTDAASNIMQDEIFGPLLPLVAYQSLDEALDYIRQRARPLALYVFGRDRRAIAHVLRNTVSGGVSVNDTLLHIAQENLPFGGVGASGMGAYHGQAGFDAFSHQKSVFTQSKINAMSLLSPPYGERFEKILRLLLR